MSLSSPTSPFPPPAAPSSSEVGEFNSLPALVVIFPAADQGRCARGLANADSGALAEF